MEAIIRCDFCIDAEATARGCFSYLLCYRWLSAAGIVLWGSASCGPVLALFLGRSEPYYVPYYRLTFIHDASMT